LGVLDEPLAALTAVLATAAVALTAVVVTATPASTTVVATDAAPLAIETTTQPLVEKSKTRQLQYRNFEPITLRII
jgi:hypothetical protein